jgi:hypothetical protein
MPRRKKRPVELKTDEAMKKLFPKRVRDEAKKIALESEKKASKGDST